MFVGFPCLCLTHTLLTVCSFHCKVGQRKQGIKPQFTQRCQCYRDIPRRGMGKNVSGLLFSLCDKMFWAHAAQNFLTPFCGLVLSCCTSITCHFFLLPGVFPATLECLLLVFTSLFYFYTGLFQLKLLPMFSVLQLHRCLSFRQGYFIFVSNLHLNFNITHFNYLYHSQSALIDWWAKFY